STAMQRKRMHPESCLSHPSPARKTRPLSTNGSTKPWRPASSRLRELHRTRNREDRGWRAGRSAGASQTSYNAFVQERLQKIIARAGVASRRHAEQLIISGQVRVNGEVVTELGSKADPAADRIEAAGRVVTEAQRHIYIALNKPPEIVASMADPEGRKTLRNLLRGLPERVYPVGRLDYSAAGLMFLTNDGDLANDMLKHWQ